jgi:hypothetical protein
LVIKVPISEEEVEGMRRSMTLNGDVIGEVENFKYLESFIQKEGGFGIFVKHMIKWG